MSTGSELRTAEAADRLAAAFGVRPFDMFGSTEGLWGCDASSTPASTCSTTCIVEDAGDRLLVTNLFNYAQPLIRFEVTDVMSFADEPCACGRSLARVRSIEGRTDDVLHLPGTNGHDVLVHPMQFGIVTADPAVREFQVVGSRDRLRLRVVLRDDADAEAASDRLRERVGDKLTARGRAHARHRSRATGRAGALTRRQAARGRGGLDTATRAGAARGESA